MGKISKAEKKQILDIIDKISNSEPVLHDAVIGKEKGIEINGDEYKLIEQYYFGHYNLIFKPKDSNRTTNIEGGCFGGATTEYSADGEVSRVYLDFNNGQRGWFVELMKHISFYF